MRYLLTLLILLLALTGGRASALSDNANSGTESFTWTAGGRALTKSNARGTTIGYFYRSSTSGVVAGSGDLTDVTYTDSTPDITYTFDRLGRMVTAASNGVTRTIDLTLHGQQESEAWTGGPLDGLTADPGFDSLRRPNALAVTGSGGTVPSQSYSYDSLTGELSTIGSGTATATYAYRTGTRQIASVTFAESATTRLTQTRAYDDLHRLTGVTSQTPGPVDLAASSYTLDDAGRRSSTLLADGTWWKYTYDDHGQVLSAERRRMTGSSPNVSDPAVPGQQFAYGYDGIGNRVAAIQGGGVTDDVEFDYTPTTANQYSAITHTRTGIVTGLVDPSATVTVNSNAAARSGPWWAQSESTSTGSSAAWLDFSIDATLGSSTDHADTQLLVPPSSVSPSYDADGNLTDDGLRTFTWDAENRLLQVTTKDTLLPVGAAMYRVTYTYDDRGRRIAQTVETRTSSSGAYVLASRRCFLFAGWSCLAEYDYAPSGGGATRTLFRSQVWGADFGGGGAGGLLLIRRHTGSLTGTHFATHDGNGNITALVNAATGLESARYDYDPFGNLLRATGPFAAENPYRFSTQFTDEVTGLLYYGYRHYDSLNGRWLSRDPIGEAGSINLYGFVGNRGINGIDILGLEGDYTQAVVDEIERQTHPDVVKAAIHFSDAEHEYNAALNSERARTDWWSKHALETTQALESERSKARAALIWAMDQAGLLPKQNCPCPPTGINMWTGRVELDPSLLWSPSQSPDYTTTEIPDSIMKLGADFASKLRVAWQKDFKSDAPILFAAWHIIQDQKIQFLLALTPMGRGCRVGGMPAQSVGPRSSQIPVSGSQWYEYFAGKYGASNVQWARLPARAGSKTSGILSTSVGEIDLMSGYAGPSASMLPGAVPGMNNILKAHVEAHAASAMRQLDLNEATLYLNNLPCSWGSANGCANMLPRMLGEGRSLRVVVPGQMDRIFTGVAR
ncbi:MAG TPA: RHS repeat-associated core domain-containing protein [Verrucomicrobiales bacterium]|nr:RHS repeat-associated core domain-containing protein [Verrucomicrobiales bacterium]